MIHHVWHSVVPNKRNRFKPHILRHEVLAIALLLLYGLQLNYNVALGSGKLLGYATNITISELTTLTNQERAAEGLGALQLDSRLNSAALAKANDMIAKDYWSHTSPSGKEPWEFILEAGYSYSYAGENLAYGFLTSSGTVQGWMDSPGHRANILNSNYSEVGFAVVDSASFQGGENTLVVAMYGHPYGTSTPSPSEPTNSASSQPSTNSLEVSEPSTQPTIEVAGTVVNVEVCRNGEELTVREGEVLETDTDAPCLAAVPQPNPEESDKVAAIAQPVESAPPNVGNGFAALVNPLDLSWPALTAVSFLSVATLASALRHIHFWQHHKPKHFIHWLQAHPVMQTALLASGLLAILVSSSGVVG